MPEVNHICSHVAATGLTYAAELSDPRLDREQRVARWREKEQRTGPAAGFLRRIPPAHPRAVPAQLLLWLAMDGRESALRGTVALALHVVTARGRSASLRTRRAGGR